jgi:hypothetical protein
MASAVDSTISPQLPPFAVVVPVGPHSSELWRAIELVKSLLFWEPLVAWCVFLDDDVRGRGLSDLAIFPASCKAITLLNPRQGSGIGWSGGLMAGMLAALDWIRANTDAQFVLKIDTDALVIAPFAMAVSTHFSDSPESGLVGAYGPSCNPAIRALVDYTLECKLVRVHRLLKPATFDGDPNQSGCNDNGFFRVPIERLRSFDQIRPFIRAALKNGYSTSEYCQGGAYALPRRTLDRMADAGCFDSQRHWPELPFCEDQAMALYARSVAFQVSDCSSPGQPFGVQYRGLPYSPDELAARGYALIHSVKNDERYGEMVIRQYFAERRQQVGDSGWAIRA